MITTVDSRLVLGSSDTYIERVGNDIRLKDSNHRTAVSLSEIVRGRRNFTINLEPGKETVFFKSPAPQSVSRAGTTNTGTIESALAFDDSIEEFVVYDFSLPLDLDLDGAVNIRFQWVPASASSNNVVWKIYYAPISSGQSFDVPLSSLTVISAGSASADVISETVITESIANLGWSAGDHLIFHVSRDAANVSDNLTGDAQLLDLVIELPLRNTGSQIQSLIEVKKDGATVSGSPFTAVNFIGASTVAGNADTADITITGSAGGSAPIGSLAFGTSAPDGTYLNANGQALSQTTYSSLYSVIGTQPSFSVTSKVIRPSNLNDIAYSASLGLYVAVTLGNNGTYTTPDLINWDIITSASVGKTNAGVTQISYCSGLGLFIGVMANGSSNVFISSDGYTWTVSHVNANRNIACATCSSTTILAAEFNDTDNSIQYVWTSTDGTSWTRRALAASGKSITAAHYSAGLSLFVIGCSDGSIQTSPDAITWTARTSNIASQINAFDSNSSLIVAVGNSGVISSSPTGATWTARTTQTSSDLRGVAYSPTTTTWVARGTVVAMASVDGTTWGTQNSRFSTSTIRNPIFYSPTDSKYCKTGDAGLLATSTDLITWTTQISAEPTIVFNTGAYGNGAYVIAGSLGKIDSSADAISWTARTANAGTNTLNHAVYIAGSTNLFIVCGVGNTIVTSPDGTTWTARTSNVVSTLNAMAFKTSSDLIVAVGSGGAITTSTDGTTWTSRTSNTTNNLNSVAWNGTIFCAVGAAGTVITSSDGITWTKQFPTGFGSNQVTWVSSDGTNFIATINTSTTANVTFISNDGITWNPYGSIINSVATNFVNGQILGHSQSGDIATSSDGKSWTIKTVGTPTTTALYWLNSKFVALTGTGGLWTSTDGITWVGPTGTKANGITYSSSQNKLVTAGTAGSILSSTDGGTTWTQQLSLSAISATEFNDIAYSPSLDLFVAVSINGVIVTSPDGSTWTQRPFTDRRIGLTQAFNSLGVFMSIIWSADKSLFVACGLNGLIATSSNGVTWTTRLSGTSQTLNCVCYNSSLALFVISAKNGLVITSSNGISWTDRETGQFTNMVSVMSLEANGFFLTTTNNQFFHSPDGITWQSYTGVPGTTTPSTRGMYSAVDGSAFTMTNAATTSVNDGLANFLVYTNDGQTIEYLPLLCRAVRLTFSAMAYDSSNDKYFITAITAGGGSIPGPALQWIITLTRTYNKTTHFALPNLTNTWIKAS